MPPTATIKRKKPKKPRPERLTANSSGAPPVGPIGPATVPQTFASSAPPFDAVYSGSLSANQNQYNNTMAQLQYQQGQIRQEYGFDDVSNPYNRAAMLQRSYEQGQTANMIGHAAQGNLYSSALQGDQNEGTFQYQRSYDSLSRDYQNQLQNITFQQAQAGTTLEQSNAQAAAAQAANWSGYTPPDPGPPSTTSGGAPTGGLTPQQIAEWQAGWNRTRRRNRRGPP